MDKEQLKEAVGELNLVDAVFEADGVSYIDTAVSVMQVYDLIDQLDEPEKVVIPKFVADRIRFSKDDTSPRNSMGEAHISKELNVWLAKTEDYMTYPNQEKFMRAWLDGYEVEKEKFYVVELINNQLTRCLAYDLVDKVFFISQNQEEKLNKFKKRFTEKEIKDYDERFWPFAVEVAE